MTDRLAEDVRKMSETTLARQPGGGPDPLRGSVPDDRKCIDFDAFREDNPDMAKLDRERLALALHTKDDDCRFMFGGECDCSWATRLDDAFRRYDDPTFPAPRDKDDWE